ncbi:hypothetical protein Hanom_Chr13g01193271 [Helianthus anomalus]
MLQSIIFTAVLKDGVCKTNYWCYCSIFDGPCYEAFGFPWYLLSAILFTSLKS